MYAVEHTLRTRRLARGAHERVVPELQTLQPGLASNSVWLPVTLALLAAGFHAALATVLFSLGRVGIARWDLLGALVLVLGAIAIARGARLAGLWAVFGATEVLVAGLLVVLGLESGWGTSLVSALVFPYLFFQEYPRHMAAAMGFAVLVGGVAVLLAVSTDPSAGLEASTLRALHAGNVAGTILLFAATGIVIARSSARLRQRLNLLREKFRQAQKLGQYTLGRQLGEGAMGKVYAASHAFLKRPAALKVINNSNVTEEMRRLFEQEVEATAGLRSPHTIEVYDFGQSEAGELFYVMEMLDGLNLQELVDQHGPVSAHRAVYILEQISHSLSEAHAKGIAHRDIKPANISLCRYGEDCDFVKVLDFGLAWDFTKRDLSDTSSEVVGTPAYVAPELALAKADSDGRADIYSLGCVAFWLLTGNRVFQAETPMQNLAAHVHAKPSAPSEVSELEIPAELDALVLQCLEKDPAARPRSAEALRDALRALPLRRRWQQEDARAWWQMHRPESGASTVGHP